MSLIRAIRQILQSSREGMTPQELREEIKARFPMLYGTESHRRNVERGHYKDLDHALLAQIYVAYRNAPDISADKSVKPMRFSLAGNVEPELEGADDPLELEVLEKLEQGTGTLYILGTHLYTKNGLEIIKIGITTGSIEQRIAQLYNTSVPFKFRLITQVETRNYAELEQSLHKLLDPFRINRSREYFTEECLPYVDTVVSVHKEIQSKS